MTGHDDESLHNPGAIPVVPARRDLRAFRRAALVLLTVALAFAGGFALFANHVSRMATPIDPKRADAIIVVTGGQFRLNAAVELLRSGKGKRLLISGVNPVATRNDLKAASGADNSLFACCVDVDHDALDTIGNAEESAEWVRKHDYRSIILVTNNYHMPRSMLEMRRLLAGAEVQPYPVVNTRLDNGEWMKRPEALRVLVTEYPKYLAALVRSLAPSTLSDPGREVARAKVASPAAP